MKICKLVLVLFLMITLTGCGNGRTDMNNKDSVEITPYAIGPLFEQHELLNAQGPVYSQSWSPDGEHLVTSGYVDLNLWDVPEGKLTLLKGHTGYIWGVAFSPDGKKIASGSQDGTTRLWEVDDPQVSTILDTKWAFCVDWNQKGDLLGIGNYDGEVLVYNTLTHDQVEKLVSSDETPIISIDWSPDGKRIAAGHWSGKIVIWDVSKAKMIREISNYTSERSDVNGIQWSPSGTLIASAHQDGIIRIWESDQGKLLRSIQAHEGWARGLAWSPDGMLLASSGEDKQACIWNPRDGLALACIKHNFLPVWSVSWSPDGNLFGSGSGLNENTRAGVTILWTVNRH